MTHLARTMLVLSLLAATASASAQFVVSRGPVDVDPRSRDTRTFDSGVRDLNPAETALLVDNLFTSVTRMRVDAATGSAGGRAGFVLPTAAFALTDEDAVTAAAFGTMTYSGTFTGGHGTVPVEFSFGFDGSFEDVVGRPTLSFSGGLTVTTYGPSGQVAYGSGVGFFTINGAPLANSIIATRAIGSSPHEPFEAARPLVTSMTFADLSAVGKVSIDLAPGTLVVVAADLAGSPATEVNADVTVRLPSAGTVDFMNTGRLRVVVPPGYGFDDPSGQFAAIVTEVPEPNMFWLMAAGTLVLAAAARRRMRHEARSRVRHRR